ncbi:MAG: hypothetical protein DMF63_01935 [Acidobacteria bacterium]|nr:MAG: hypothetical protein DMF63_01935 [Acidobacteriota bacterium]
MKARLLVLFLSLLVCAFSAVGQTVIESGSSLIIAEKSINLSLAIEYNGPPREAQIELFLLDPGSVSKASSTQSIRLLSGRKSYKLAIPIGDLMKEFSDEIAWWRIQYRIGSTNGIASISELMRDDFDLRASAFQRVIPGEPFRIRVRSLNPFSEKPVKGVAIKAELTISLDTEAEKDELKLNATARTDGDGFANLDFKVPADIKLDGAPEILINGQKNGVVRKIEEDFNDSDLEGSVVLTTDKPLYQPGQTFNVRGLFLDPNNTVVPNAELEFRIEDEDGTVVFRQTLKTSAFGIASISWPIPDSAKLGTYRVMIEADSDLSENQLAFKITRYDLPNFTVSTQTDKTYYLTTDSEASITVSADYLFGKPVTSGKVRVVRESERKWNYREQKYEAEEGPAIEGSADSSGKFVGKFDLKEDISELKSSEWRRHSDLSFAAYYTDPTTNRTEQRRFDIRLTKEPIHIYFVRLDNQHPDLPIVGYVSTFYADGTPASCNVEVRDSKTLQSRLKTNSLGAGKFVIEAQPSAIKGSEYAVRISARDRKGLEGTFEESFYLTGDDAIQIETNNTIYKPGEPIDVELRSTQRSGFVYVDLVKSWSTLESRVAELHKGVARLTIPYRPEFKGDIVIAAYTDKESGRWVRTMRTVRGIIYPEQQNLLISAKFSKDQYRPNEDATVRFSILDGSRKPVEGVIGLGIFDKAIEERARTDSEFGAGYFNRFYRLMGYDRSYGNLSLKDLNDLDLSRPIKPEFQLAAEIMLAANWYFPTVYHSDNRDAEAKTIYGETIKKTLKEFVAAIEAQYRVNYEHPVDRSSFDSILSRNGIDPLKMLDPWGQPFVADFSIDRMRDLVTLTTSGPDKQVGTVDDFEVWRSSFEYFTKTGLALDRAVNAYHLRTGLYIRDKQTLAAELAEIDFDQSRLKDRWGRDYQITFDISGRNFLIRIYSLGANGIYEPDQYRTDDFEVWKTSSDYFSPTEQTINRILSEEVNQRHKPFPKSEAEFRDTLRRGGLDLAAVKDGWGREVYVTGELEKQYVDKTKIVDGKTTITTATEEMMTFRIRSNGADPSIVSDDKDIAFFSAAITAASRGSGFRNVEVSTTVFSGAKGAITGTITDANGAVIPNADVVATNQTDESQKFSTTSDEDGKFLIGNLPSGRYALQATSPGFQMFVYRDLQVRSQSLIELNFSLSVGNTTATVDVIAAPSEIDTTTSYSVSKNETANGLNIQFPYKEETSTPRLREYFPESLVWKPELITDKKGKAEVNFKMADNITTWKMFAIASNKKGKVGIVEKEVTAFQSFFVDLDPPKFLTEGDEIYLPTQVRNYTDRKQRVNVTMTKGEWFDFLGGSGAQNIDVATGASQNAIFGFRATTPIDAGKQRVTAIAQTDSDAIEKPVTVRPNGEEIVRSDSKVFETSTKFDVTYPANALPNTSRAELKIYPNLFAHVSDSVDGLLERPHGCGEQTISSTYPNLMILKFTKGDSPIRTKAMQYLRKGYDRLTGYQVADGGFSYWGSKDTSDIALTAYAVRFLTDAKEFIDVNDDAIKRAEAWLMSQQQADGSWTKIYRWESSADASRTKLITTYVARSLAMRVVTGTKQPNSPMTQALKRALAYLNARNAEIDEPYALALFGLASLDAGDTATADRIAAQLEKMAIAEGNGAYWKLETNTPFYGWGTAGRVETTALVVQLLARTSKLKNKPAGEIVSKGLIFLLKNKDRYGVWYSTQTTINVLDSFLALLGGENLNAQTIQIIVNGTALPDIAIAADRIDPVTVDLKNNLAPTSNAIEIRSSGNSQLMAQIVSKHYIDWRDSVSTNTTAGESRALKLDYNCDRANAAIMEDVTCSVDAERIGFKGYGMLLAEIGIPPGADVSRESLEAAMQSDWSLSRYDILPDRIVLYMWSKAGGTKFNFKFRSRYGIKAQTPSSIVYDYYNPDACAKVAPLKFEVK